MWVCVCVWIYVCVCVYGCMWYMALKNLSAQSRKNLLFPRYIIYFFFFYIATCGSAFACCVDITIRVVTHIYCISLTWLKHLRFVGYSSSSLQLTRFRNNNHASGRCPSVFSYANVIHVSNRNINYYSLILSSTILSFLNPLWIFGLLVFWWLNHWIWMNKIIFIILVIYWFFVWVNWIGVCLRYPTPPASATTYVCSLYQKSTEFLRFASIDRPLVGFTSRCRSKNYTWCTNCNVVNCHEKSTIKEKNTRLRPNRTCFLYISNIPMCVFKFICITRKKNIAM